MSGYTPVFKSILQSTIWECKPHVKVVWWTMLLMCDRDGIVEGSIPGLARSAVVTREECEEALSVLMSPDPDSRTKEFEGRRIVEIDGGWALLNHETYKKKLGMVNATSRERVARFRDRQRTDVDVTDERYNVTDVTLETPDVTNCNHLDQDLNQDQDQDVNKKQSNHNTYVCSSESETGRRNSRKKQPVEPPDQFVPSDATRRCAEKYSRNIELDWEECRDWHLKKGSSICDWQATLRTWMSRANGFTAKTQPAVPCPDKVEFTEKHRGIANRGSIDINLAWTKFKANSKAGGRRAVDWSAAFEATLAEAVDRIERAAAYRANGQDATPVSPGASLVSLSTGRATDTRPRPETRPTASSAEVPKRRDMASVLEGIG